MVGRRARRPPGDRPATDASPAAFGARWNAGLRAAPSGAFAGQLTCRRGEVEGLLGDVAAMLPLLRRCLTMPNGYPVAFLATEPAFARPRADPRVRALAAELAAAEARARSTPVPAAPVGR